MEPNTQLKNWKEKLSSLETVGVLLLVSEELDFTQKSWARSLAGHLDTKPPAKIQAAEFYSHLHRVSSLLEKVL